MGKSFGNFCEARREVTGNITPHSKDLETTNPQALPAGPSEWAILDSNQRPHACDACALAS